MHACEALATLKLFAQQQLDPGMLSLAFMVEDEVGTAVQKDLHSLERHSPAQKNTNANTNYILFPIQWKHTRRCGDCERKAYSKACRYGTTGRASGLEEC